MIDVAVDFRETEREWREIRSRSASLSPADRNRLERILAFLEDELNDAAGFQKIAVMAATRAGIAEGATHDQSS